MFFRLFSLWKGYLISEYKSLSQFKKGKCFRQSGSGGQGIPTYLVWLTNFQWFDCVRRKNNSKFLKPILNLI